MMASLLRGTPAMQRALVPFDVRLSRAILLDVAVVESHAPPQSNILVVGRR
jgi:hypothetical protein